MVYLHVFLLNYALSCLQYDYGRADERTSKFAVGNLSLPSAWVDRQITWTNHCPAHALISDIYLPHGLRALLLSPVIEPLCFPIAPRPSRASDFLEIEKP